MHVVAEAQRNGGICAYIDAEHAMDPIYARAIGVDVDELLISQPDTGEQALEITDMLVRSGALDVVVIDSVAALTPRAEIEGEMGDTHVGLQARLMSQALRKLTANLNKTDTICIFINQLREKIGVMFGSPETTPGGRALKFYSSVRLDIRRIESIKDGVEVVGNRTRVKVVKNKVAPPFRQAEFDIMYGKGISREGSLLDIGVDLGIVKKSGAWYTYEGEQLGQGRENAKQFLHREPRDHGRDLRADPRSRSASAGPTSRRRRPAPRSIDSTPTTCPSASTTDRLGVLAGSSAHADGSLPRRCRRGRTGTTVRTVGLEGRSWSRCRRTSAATSVAAPLGAQRWNPQGLEPVEPELGGRRDGRGGPPGGGRRGPGRRRRRAEPGDQGGGHRPGLRRRRRASTWCASRRFADIEIDGERRTAIRLCVEDRAAGHAGGWRRADRPSPTAPTLDEPVRRSATVDASPEAIDGALDQRATSLRAVT